MFQPQLVSMPLMGVIHVWATANIERPLTPTNHIFNSVNGALLCLQFTLPPWCVLVAVQLLAKS